MLSLEFVATWLAFRASFERVAIARTDVAIHAFFGTSRHCLHDESTLLAPSVRPGVVVQRGGDGQICSGLEDSRRCRSPGRLVSRDLHLTPAATVVVVLCVLTTIC